MSDERLEGVEFEVADVLRMAAEVELIIKEDILTMQKHNKKINNDDCSNDNQATRFRFDYFISTHISVIILKYQLWKILNL